MRDALADFDLTLSVRAHERLKDAGGTKRAVRWSIGLTYEELGV